MKIRLLSILLILVSCGNQSNNNSTDKTNNNITETSNIGNLFLGVIDNDTLLVKAIPVIDDGDTLYESPAIYKGRNVLYQDTSNNLFIINETKCFMKKVNSTNYIFLNMFDAPFENKWHIVEISNNHVKVYKNILQNIFKDINKDGFCEVGGRYATDAICLDCDSAFYSPYLIYSLKNELVFDSVLSIKLTEETYGFFLGFDVVDTILVQQNNF
ncbi:MAG: hypothetical protein LBN95_09100 [Prevotellaceae bacterium]|jgi:hypothetical protein|nr:hypothetical protein [Prevotellaceae bacterium]